MEQGMKSKFTLNLNPKMDLGSMVNLEGEWDLVSRWTVEKHGGIPAVDQMLELQEDISKASTM